MRYEVDLSEASKFARTPAYGSPSSAPQPHAGRMAGP